MKGIRYQLKNMRRDKLSLLSFFLPIIVALLLNLLSDINLSALGETKFGAIHQDLTSEMVHWLEKNGSLSFYDEKNDLHNAIIDPASQIIGVIRHEHTIKTILAGDEWQLYANIAHTLPQLYEQRYALSSIPAAFSTTMHPQKSLKPLLLVITLFTAMFMGSVFNAVSMIEEKEEGILFVNEILPFCKPMYILQKTSIGFIGGFMATMATILVSGSIKTESMLLLFPLVLLSNALAALLGLYIGRFADGLMVGIVIIKFALILLLAPPILFYFMIPATHVARILTFLLPSSTVFYALMEVVSGTGKSVMPYIGILCLHLVLGFSFYFYLVRKEFGIRHL